MSRTMAPLLLLALLAMAGCAQGQQVYRVLVLTRWNVTKPADIKAVAKIEEGLVFPCTQYIIRGAMGYTANLTGTDTASYAKVYDFASMADYDKYKACSNAIAKQTDAWQVFKARAAFKVAGTPLPATGTFMTLGIANATNPVAAVAQLGVVQKAVPCLYTSWAAASADAAANAVLKGPTNLGYWASYPESANSVAAEAYLYVGRPKSLAKLITYFTAPTFTAGFVATKIK